MQSIEYVFHLKLLAEAGDGSAKVWDPPRVWGWFVPIFTAFQLLRYCGNPRLPRFSQSCGVPQLQDQLHPGADCKFRIDVLQVKFNRAVRNAQPQGDQFVAFALQEQAYNFVFPPGQWNILGHDGFLL
jgi:hypothetical protein